MITISILPASAPSGKSNKSCTSLRYSGGVKPAFAVALALPLLLQPLRAQTDVPGNKGYYRYPAIHGDTVVFTSEGDLWTVPTSGGKARRLTSHPGDETRAAISPDGSTIAYSATYEGPTEVYTIPLQGGQPRRRTFDGNALVVGWTPDNKILFKTRSLSTLPSWQLATIDAANNVVQVPLSEASQGSWSAGENDRSRRLFFTRTEFQGSMAKRYQGGTAQNLWRYDPGREAIPLTANWPGTSKDAMWWNNRVYFLTDRDGTMNLWSMTESGTDLRQLAKHTGFDADTPALSNGRIIYALGADLRLYDIAAGTDRQIPIAIESDFDNLREHWIKNPLEYTTSAHVAPDGGRVVITSRGRAFVIPVKQGRLSEVGSGKPGRIREARFGSDGKSVVMLSTESGEVEIWKAPSNGTGPAEQLSTDGTVLRWEAIPSPDGKWIAHQDKNDRLWLLDAATKAAKQIGTTTAGDNSEPKFFNLKWSPDSRWLAYGKEGANLLSRLYLYNVETGIETPLTTDRYDNRNPAWSKDGKWLYFLSDRALSSVVKEPWGARQPDPFFDRPVRIYGVALRKGLRPPFQAPDELHPADGKETDKETGKDDKQKDAKKSEETPGDAKLDIDLEGIVARLHQLPVPPGNYSSLAATENRLCWIDKGVQTADTGALQCWDVNSKGDNPDTLLPDVLDFEVSGDWKKIMIRKKEEILVVDAATKGSAMGDSKVLSDARVALANWTFSVIPTDEFREAFADAWRLHRDYFYDTNMHGVNWKLMRQKYGELLGRVRDRNELSTLIAGMVSELSALHTFVFGGDSRKGADDVQLATLGARLSRDPASGGYRVDHVYLHDPDRPDKMSPLARPGVEVGDGDVILAVNGKPLATLELGEALRNQAGKQVLLKVSAKGGTGESAVREVVATAISLSQDQELRYSEWEYTRRTKVEQASGGSIGYVHLRAMQGDDIAQWNENYIPVVTRDGLIVDARHNRGGNIDSWILDRLSRKPWMYWQPRVGHPTWNMQQAFRGHVVVLCDAWTASDGEAFSEGFKRLGLGKVIGTRTWGGEVWLTASNTLADKGIASAAEIGVYGPEGKWLIEGHGVEPDIIVDNPPHATFEGGDAQLDAAVKYLQELIRQKPVKTPAPPPYPDKSFKGGR